MLSERLQGELNQQINYELYSAYLYASMETYFLGKSLNGFANWLKVQTQEEMAHARIFFEFMHRKNAAVDLEAIGKPDADFRSILDVFERALAHEKFVTGRIYTLMDIAKEEREHSTVSFLQWFVDEQVEEEDNFQGLVDKLKLIGDNPHALLMLDAELAARVFVMPAPLSTQAQP
ncbi:MAG: ferritin [Clostridia bacterium]|nr:ferritin [Clostridia bacterium]